MIHVYALTAIALLVAVAVAGAAAAILTVISVATHHEQRARSFTTGSPSRATSGVRALNGHYARRPGVTAQQVSPHWRDLSA
jgi:hypothetical protein